MCSGSFAATTPEQSLTQTNARLGKMIMYLKYTKKIQLHHRLPLPLYLAIKVTAHISKVNQDTDVTLHRPGRMANHAQQYESIKYLKIKIHKYPHFIHAMQIINRIISEKNRKNAKRLQHHNVMVQHFSTRTLWPQPIFKS